jgi:hypothetical protein
MKDSTKNVLTLLMILATCIFVCVVAPKGKLSSHDKLLQEVEKKVGAGNHYVDGKILNLGLTENKQNTQLNLVQEQITALVMLLDEKMVLDRLDALDTLNERIAGIEFQVSSLLDTNGANNQNYKDCYDEQVKIKKELELIKAQLAELSKKEKSVITKRTYVCPCNPCNPCR